MSMTQEHSRREFMSEGVEIKGRPGLWAEIPCTRCGGTGHVGYGNAVDGTRCYACWYHPGVGELVRVDEKHIRKLERDAERRAERTRKAAEKRKAADDARRAENLRDFERAVEGDAELAEAYRVGHNHATIVDIRVKHGRYGSISGAQRDLVLKIARDLAERHADAAVEVPEGRMVITGVVKRAYKKETGFGSRFVMVVRDDRGFSVWGTVPTAIVYVERGPFKQAILDEGDRVTFTAKIERSEGDPNFGFFSRPTKAEVLEVAPLF